MNSKFRRGDHVRLDDAIFEVLGVESDTYIIRLKHEHGRPITDGMTVSFPTFREVELRAAAWPRTVEYRGYTLEIEETSAGFKASATLLEPSPWPADEQVIVPSVIAEDRDEALARMREIIDDELGTDAGGRMTRGGGPSTNEEV